MRIIEPGTLYQLQNYNNGDIVQEVRFYTKIDNENFIDGATIEEIMKLVIARMEWLQEKGRSKENEYCIQKLHEAFFWLKQRKFRQGRNKNNN